MYLCVVNPINNQHTLTNILIHTKAKPNPNFFDGFPPTNKLQTLIPVELLTKRVMIHASICKLESLRPSRQVNSLFTQLVKLCTLPLPIDISELNPEAQAMHQSLIIFAAKLRDS